MNSNILDLINNNKWEDAMSKINNNIFMPLFNGKTLFHYACMRGNKEIIDKYLQTKSDKIYMSDDDGNTGMHLLAFTEWDNILFDILESYPIFLKLKNINDNFIHDIVKDRIITLSRVIDMLAKNKYGEYLTFVKYSGRNSVLDIIDLANLNPEYLQIIKKIHKMKLDFTVPIISPPLIYAITKNYHNVCIFMLKELKFDVNVKTDRQFTPLILTILDKSDDLISLILALEPDINYSGLENKYVPLSLCFKNGLINIAEKIILNKDLDFDKRDSFLNTPIYYLIWFIVQNHNMLKKEALDQLKTMLNVVILKSNLQNLNINNETPLHLLVKNKLWEHHKNAISSKNIDVNSISKTKESVVTLINKSQMPTFLELIESNIKLTESEKSTKSNVLDNVNVILPKVNIDGEFGLFNADGIHNIIYIFVMLEKYNNLTIPMQNNINEKKIWDGYLSLTHFVPSDGVIDLIHSLATLYYNTFYCVFPCIIAWKDKHLNYYCRDTIYLERELGTPITVSRFVVFRITIILDESLLHANIVIYDKKLNKLIRFEPYGDWEFHDSYSLDQLLINMFKKSLEKSKAKSLKYVRPRDFLDKTKFQTTSMGDHFTEKNLGDPIGYCLAWCFWFLELKINNPDDNENILVDSALDKIIKSDNNNSNPLLTHIRGYAKQLDKEKNIFLQKIGVDKSDLYKMSYGDKKIAVIKKYVENYVSLKLQE